jgi:hypothetical protein
LEGLVQADALLQKMTPLAKSLLEDESASSGANPTYVFENYNYNHNVVVG